MSSIGFREIQARQGYEQPLLASGESSADCFRVHLSGFSDLPKREFAKKVEMHEIPIGLRELVYCSVQDRGPIVLR
jgi:hypothetical protein